jgi:endonuclease YncB( thermonuclease family)
MTRRTGRPLTTLFGLILLTAHASAQVVQRVVDGDTLVLARVGTVRLIGIDSPESIDPRKLVQYFGKEAAAFLRQLSQGKLVRMEYDVERFDKYRRTLAYVYLADGTFVNAEMIRQGYAHAYTQFPFRYLQQFLAFEREAREADRGLWSGGQPLAPPTFSTGPSLSAGSTDVVYVTRTGKEYHRAGCPYLARSQILISLKDVPGHYTPCRVCKPPILTK